MHYTVRMSEISFLSQEIYNRYGTIQRARSCFLYTKKGIRLTDLYQEGGRAILGWGGSSAFTMFKNALSRGITGTFITEYDYRTEKAVSSLLASQRKIFFFHSKKDALKAALELSPDGTNFYKPWSDADIRWPSLPCIIVEPPLAWTADIFILAVLPELLDGKTVDAGVKLNAPMQAAVTRSIYNLIKALQERKETDWFIYDKFLLPYFERKGPYLFPKVPEEKYRGFVLHMLNLGIVISPSYNLPSIVPFGADKGVFTVLKNNPFNY